MAVSPLERGGRRPGCVAVWGIWQQPHTPRFALPLSRGENTFSSIAVFCIPLCSSLPITIGIAIKNCIRNYASPER
jgi:hypothetical protein